MPNSTESAKTVFGQALAIESAEQQVQFLDQACEDNPELRAEVEDLLSAADRAGDFLGEPSESVAPTFNLPVEEKPGTQIGPYKLLQQIGEGGMGVVYMAQQSEPVERRVALKIIKPGMDTRAVVARFEAEEQALAMMDHPGIAKVYDAGATDSGRPYFVMELVKGSAITKYCDEHHLTPKHRLDLFTQVCQAVQHAHQKGIIHRDLKPSNVLVAEYDDKPVPKIIDFGVAKALDKRLTDKTMFTELGQVVGTLEYMSPEQAKVNQNDIDTRSDIYALGVLLYELLTGTTPFTKERLRSAALDEVMRIIREEEPPKPSTRLSTIESLPTIAANRGLEPNKLSMQVRGDLDWIAMKALEKDRSRRYDTASAFGADIRRYLNDETIDAHAPSAAYRFRKFVRRNKATLFTVALIGVTLLVATVLSTVQAIRAERARKEAHDNLGQALDAADQLLTEVAENTLLNQPHMEQLRHTLLRRALVFYRGFRDKHSSSPELRYQTASAEEAVGRICEHLGRRDEAQDSWRRAISTLETLSAENPREPKYRSQLAWTCYLTGRLLYVTGDLEKSERMLNRALDLNRELCQSSDNHTYWMHLADCHNMLGTLFEGTQRLKEADDAYRESIRILSDLVDRFGKADARRRLASAHSNLGILLDEKKSQANEAEKEFARAMEIWQELVEQFPEETRYQYGLAIIQHNIAIFLRKLSFRGLRKTKDSIDAFGRAIDSRKKLSDDYPGVLEYREQLGDSYYELGRLLASYKRPNAADTLNQAVSVRQKLVDQFPADSSYQSKLGSALNILGIVMRETGRLEQSRHQLESAVKLHQMALSAETKNSNFVRWLAFDYLELSETFVQLGDHEAAVSTATKGPETRPNDLEQYARVAKLLRQCAELAIVDSDLSREQRQQTALEYEDQACRLYRQTAEHGVSVSTVNNQVAWVLVTSQVQELRDPSHAVELIEQALQQHDRTQPNERQFRRNYWNTLGVARYRGRQWEQSIEALEKSMELTEDGEGSFEDWIFLAMVHHQRGDKEQAHSWNEKAIGWMDNNEPDTRDQLRFRAEAEQLIVKEKDGGLGQGKAPAEPPKRQN